MSKLERLLNLTALLLETERPITIEQIGEQVPGYASDPASFRRAFERDKDDLREMNIPIELVQLDASDQTVVGYRIPKDEYYLPDPELTGDELAALHLAAAAVRVSDRSEVEAFRKLGGLPGGAGATPSAVAATSGELPFEAGLADLFAGVVERRVATFSYGGQERVLQPQRLDFQRGRWYVTGHDVAREARRTFRLDRISSDVRSGPAAGFDPIEGGEGVRLEPWRFGDDPPVRAEVLVDASHVQAARQRFVGAEEVAGPGGGSIVFILSVSNRESFRAAVLGLLDHAEVLSPAELRDDIARWLSGVAS